MLELIFLKSHFTKKPVINLKMLNFWRLIDPVVSIIPDGKSRNLEPLFQTRRSLSAKRLCVVKHGVYSKGI